MSNRQYGKWSSALSKALTLDERIQLLQLSGRERIPARQAARAKKIMAAWKQRKPFSTATAFQRRLNDQMMEEATLYLAIAMPVNHAVRRHIYQKRIWKNYGTLIRGHLENARHSVETDDRWGFSRLVRPLIEQSLSTLRGQLEIILARDIRSACNIEHICKQVEQDLINHTSSIVRKTCLLELRVAKLSGKLGGSSGTERYASYLKLLENASFAGRFFLEYPVLLEIVATRLNMLCENTLEFFTHLVEDFPLIESDILDECLLGPIKDWKAGKGDSHCGGKSVVTLRFEDGRQLIYKPRSLSVDVGFNRLVNWCNEKTSGRHLRTVRTLDCGSHGWCEHIDQRELESSEEIRDFYHRQGKFIALFHALQANDLHYENMIVYGAHPVYVDLETLFHPPSSMNAMVDMTEAVHTPAATVLDTFILPTGRRVSNDKSHIDISIFGADPEQELRPGLFEAESGTDDAYLSEKTGKIGTSSHLPHYQGKPVAAKNYTKIICEGFAEFYQMIERESHLLSAELPQFFSNAKVRHLARPTSLYSTIVGNSLHPDYLRNELERRALLERLFSNVRDHEWINKLLASEMRDMAVLDVPYFYRQFAEDKFYDSHETEIPGLRMPSPESIVKHHLSRLCESDMAAQLELIELSLLSDESIAESIQLAHPAFDVQHHSANLSTAPVDEAIALAMDLKSKVVCSGGDSYWMCQVARGESLVVTSPNVLDLYDGQLGIALYLGMLSAVTGLSDFESLTMNSLETIRRWTRAGRYGFTTNGVYNGSMGYAYVFANLGVSLKRDYLLNEAFEWISGFDPERENDNLDVIGGAAGCVLFLSELLGLVGTRDKSKTQILGLIDFFAKRIASEAKREAMGVSWRIPMKADRPLTGFAHGNAGFAAALFTCTQILGQDKYRDLGYAAISFENYHYSRKYGGWRDLMDVHGTPHSSEVKCAWCRGAPGVVLGRLIALESMDRADVLYPILTSDVVRGMEAATPQEHSNNASLCHGTFGNNEIFEMAHGILPDGQWQDLYDKFGSRSNNSVNRRCGDFGRNPVGSRLASQGLMTGSTGIGYGLLRQAAPQIVPSVLRLSVARQLEFAPSHTGHWV